MREEHKQQIKNLEDELGKSVEACHNKISDLMRIIEDQAKALQVVDELKQDNVNLRTKVKSLEVRLEDMEQYSRVNCIEINGVPENKNEDIVEVVKNIGNKLEVTIKDEDIDACHRLGIKQNDRPRGIMIKFVRRSTKEDLLHKRKIKRNFNTHDIGFTGKEAEVVYVNESLSAARRKLLNAARAVKKEKQYSFVWVKNGKVFLRKNEGDKTILVTSLEQVATLQ